jgi:uracil-DNA glycosylase
MTIKETWIKLFNNYNSIYESKSLLNIENQINFLKTQYKENNLKFEVFPKVDDIYKCFTYFETYDTKVIILGQDPYHGPNQATGLCFGVNSDVRIPPSLRNIKKELFEDINKSLDDITLEKWAKQGILMLNASLSVIQGKPASQMKLWSDFTDFVIKKLSEDNENIVFVAWGAFAHGKFKAIDTIKHKLLISSHPSPLSVYKKYKEYPAFSGSKPFSQINKFLAEKNSKLIDW